MKFTILFTSLLFTTPFSLVQAGPFTRRDVFVPPILQPTASTVWQTGSYQQVEWDVTNIPQQITNPRGKILLRKGEKTLNITLAEDFDITMGAITVQVPGVMPNDDYSIVLFGDSGNISPKFPIDDGVVLSNGGD